MNTLKKNRKFYIVIIALAIIGLAAYTLFSSLAIKSYISKDMKVDFPDKFLSHEIVRCNFGINNIEYAFIGEYKDRIDNLKIFFYKMKRGSLSPINDWSDKYIGGTTIKNTIFPELVEMVKEDCGQFQLSKGNHYDETINWSYSSYTPEPELTGEEQKEKELEDLADELRGELMFYSEEDKKYVEETYGITVKSLDFEFLEWYEKGKADGFFEY